MEAMFQAEQFDCVVDATHPYAAAVTENIFAMDAQTREAKGIASLPGTLHEAVKEMKADELICETLGEHVVTQYAAGKEKEWDAYRTHVSRWEIERYLVTY